MRRTEQERVTADQIRERFKWNRVVAPKAWYPKDLEEELIGYYGGRTVKQGHFGQYEVALVHVPLRGSFLVSGAMIIQLIDASMVEVGHPIRIVWRGFKKLGMEGDREKKMKLFELYVAEGDPLDADVLPEVRR